MLIRTGLEIYPGGSALAWSLEHPGLFASGPDGESALAGMPAAWQAYAARVKTRAAPAWLPEEEAEVCLEETWEIYTIDEHFKRASQGYEVGSWFLADWKPLTQVEIEHALQILAWSREDLLATVAGLSSAILECTYPHERWSIAGILKHIGGAEWWYLDRLGLAFPRSEVPEDPFERLEKVRHHLRGCLPALAGSIQVVGVDGEFWSPRKVLRRAVWHEIDHIGHIRKLL